MALSSSTMSLLIQVVDVAVVLHLHSGEIIAVVSRALEIRIACIRFWHSRITALFALSRFSVSAVKTRSHVNAHSANSRHYICIVYSAHCTVANGQDSVNACTSCLLFFSSYFLRMIEFFDSILTLKLRAKMICKQINPYHHSFNRN